MFKTFPIVLDVTKHQLNDMFQVNSNDLNTVRLNLSIKSGLDIFDLTGKIVRIAIKKPDGFIAFQTGGVTDPSNGLCEFILDRQAYLVEGKHEAEVMIYQDDSTVIVTERFYYKVNRAIVNDKTLLSTNHLPAINQAIIAGEQLKDIDIPEFVEAANSAYETIEEAETQGLYAKGQGDYAKQEADRAAARVTELNGVDAVQFKGRQDGFDASLLDIAKDIVALGKATGNILDSKKYPIIAPENSDSGRIQRLFNDSVGKIAVIPSGDYTTSVELVLPVGVRLVMHQDAVIKATSAMESVLTTPIDIQHVDGFISGGVLDANNLAKNGLHLKYFKNFFVEKTKVKKTNEVMFKFGSSLSAVNSYGVYAYNIVGDRLGGTLAPAGSIGLTFENCTDNKFINPLMIGNKTGFKLNSSNNEFINAHAWNYPSNGSMDKGFHITGMSNFLTNCFSDTPSLYGFHIENFNNFLIGCKTYINTTTLGTDNVVTSVQVETNGQYSSFIGCFAFGTDATHRLAKDFGGVLTNVTIIGCQTSNVVTTTKSRIQPLGPITVDSITTTNSGDGAEVAKFSIERSWRMVQKGAGAAASLMFQPGSANKNMGVLAFDGSYALEIEAIDDATGPSRGKIDGKYIVNVKNGTGNPNGVVSPDFLGQEYMDTTAKISYKACGTGNTDWKQTSFVETESYLKSPDGSRFRLTIGNDGAITTTKL